MKFPRIQFTSQTTDGGAKKLPRVLRHYKAKSAWGLDFGGNALKAVKINCASGEPVIEAMDIIEYPPLPPDVNFLQSTQALEAVQSLIARHGITKTDTVTVSVPGQSVLSRFTTVPPVDKKQLRDIVGFEAKQQIPFDLNEVVWDYQQLSEHTPGAEVIEIGLFASKRTTLDQILANVVPLKPGLTALQVSALAIANFVLFDKHVDGQTVIINVETENTDLIVIEGLRIWVRSILLSAIDADLVKEIQRSMEYYKSMAKEASQCKTILLMGNKFKDPAHVKCITDSFPFDTKVLTTVNALKLSPKIAPEDFSNSLVNLGVALGLAIQGAGLGQVNVNLLPPEFIKTAEISKKKPYAIAIAGCATMFLIVQYGGMRFMLARLQNSASHHQRILQNVKDFERKYKNVETLAQTNKTALDLISSIDSNRFFWMESLDRLISLIPENVSINSIQSSWLDPSDLVTKVLEKQTGRADFFQAKRPVDPSKPGTSRKALIMGIKGESREPSMGFIEERILKPIRNITLRDQKVPAFKNVEIVPGSCRQIDHNGEWQYISFEIRWIVKSQDEILLETKSLPGGKS